VFGKCTISLLRLRSRQLASRHDISWQNLLPGERLEYLLEYLYNNIEPAKRAGAAILIRPSVKYQISPDMLPEANGTPGAAYMAGKYAFVDDIVGAVKRVFRRFSDSEIRILHSSGFRHHLSRDLNSAQKVREESASDDAKAFLIEEVRNAEIDHLVETGSCKLPPLPGQFYKVPSGRYVRSFLRVGSLQTSRAAIDAMFFWLIPYLEGCVGVISDTWSISSISQAVSRRLVDYCGEPGFPCPVEMLGDYHNRRDSYGNAAVERIERFLGRIGESRPDGAFVLILISATHTGSLVEIVKEKMASRSIEPSQVKFVSIFKLALEADIDFLRDYSLDPDFEPVRGDLSEDAKDSSVTIDGTAYFPTTEIDIEVTRLLDAVTSYRAFAERYHNIPFARVHVTDSSSDAYRPRHHAVWLDTTQLVHSTTFREAFKAKVDALNPTPKIIIYPDHEAARCLARVAEEHLSKTGNTVQSWLHNDLRLEPDVLVEDAKLKAQFNELGLHDAILIVDDVFITGLRISAYQKNLRDVGFSGSLQYIAGVARPSNETHWQNHARAFLHARGAAGFGNEGEPAPNIFESVEKLILPNWDEASCPWCRERELMQAHAKYLVGRDPAEYENDGGFSESIFAVSSAFRRDDFELKSGSFFGPTGLTQASTFALLAGTIQTLRTKRFGDTPLLGARHYLVSVVLGLAVYQQYFTDSVLVGSFLKCLFAHELAYRNQRKEDERTRAFLNFISVPTNESLISEVLLAALDGKFPQLKIDKPEFVEKLKRAGMLA
jgi:hypothetical protein